MKCIHYLFLMMLAVLVGCQSDDNLSSSGKTGLMLTLIDDADNALSRKTPSELGKPVSGMFNLLITNSEDGKKAFSGGFTETVLLKEGIYDITARCGENPVIALDSPYYEGVLNGQSVTVGEMTPVSISCTVANALLSVIYNDEILGKFYENYFVTVSVENQSVEIDSKSGKSAYFKAGSSLKLVFHGFHKGTENEVVFEIPQQDDFVDIQAKSHIKVALSMDDSDISSGVGISVEKIETDIVSIEETLPLEFLPKPKISSEGFVGNELIFAETEKKSAVIDLDLSSPLQELKLKFNSADPRFAGLDSSKEYLLSNSEDKLAVETALGISLPEIGSLNAGIDFSSLIPNLLTDDGNTVKTVIEIDAKANNRWTSEGETDALARTFTLTCNKPIFSVGAYPGNIWTKEFTMNSLQENQVESGDYNTLLGDIVYQYSINGNDWEVLGDDLTKTGLTPGSTYYIRGLYRGVIDSKITEITTCPIIEIPNGNMESWRTLTKSVIPGANIFKKVTITADYPDNSIWSCVNVKTFESTPNIKSTYNMIASTYKETGRSGYAAALRTVGWDNGTGNTTSIIYHVSAGKLFLGTYSFNHDDNSEVYNYGIEYNSRPTNLRFFYKYSPYNNDSFKVVVVLENRNEGVITRIGQTEFVGNENKSDFTELSVPIEYINMELPITHMYVLFSSSAGCSDNESEETDNLEGMVSGGDYHQGSVFIIDDVEFQYLK